MRVNDSLEQHLVSWPTRFRLCLSALTVGLLVAVLPASARAARYMGFELDNSSCSAPARGDALYRGLNYARRYGANVVRTCIRWTDVGDRRYRAKLTRYIQREAAVGIRPILLLYVRENANQIPPLPPAGPYAQAAAEVAQLWGRYAAAIEIYNEPNNGGEEEIAGEYMDVLRPTYRAVKSVAPNLPVLAGSIAYADDRFLRALYADGLHGNFDGIRYHPYTLNAGPDAAVRSLYSFREGGPLLYSIMVENGDADKTIWITEMGWTTATRAELSGYAEANSIVTDAQRARYIREAAQTIRTWPWLACVGFYQLRDNDRPPSSYRHSRRRAYEWFMSGYALLTQDWRPTISLLTLAKLRY
jgi:hypothetical protein